MKYEKDRKIFGIDEYLLIKTLKKYALPIIAAVLVLIILISDLPKRLKKDDPGAATTAAAQENAEAQGGAGEEGDAAAAETTRAPIDYANAVPSSSGNTELNSLIDRFLEARVNGDADSMYRIFGRTDDTGLEELRAQMKEEKRLYDSFSGTENFVIPGVTEDSWIVYIKSNGWFKKITSSAPVLMRAYVERGSDGEYYIKEDSALTEEEKAAVAAADSSESVRKMNKEYRTELAKAIVQDGKLGSLYERLREGAGDAGTAAGSGAPGAAGGNVGIVGADGSEAALQAGSTAAAGEQGAESAASEAETETVAEAVVEVNVTEAQTEAETEAQTETGTETSAETESAAESAGAETTAESAGAESAAETSAGT